MDTKIRSIGLLIIILFKSYSICLSQTLEKQASDVFDVLVNNFQVNPPTPSAFWRENGLSGLGASSNNLWEGFCGIQPALFMQSISGNQKYKNQINSFASWIINIWKLRGNIDIVNSYTNYFSISSQSSCWHCTPNDTETPNNWSDDGAWNIRGFVRLYEFTKDSVYLNHALAIFQTMDTQWGLDAPDLNGTYHTRVIRFADGGIDPNNRCNHWNQCQTQVMATSVMNGLMLFNKLKPLKRLSEAYNCLDLACKYYNVMENDVRGKGPCIPDVYACDLLSIDGVSKGGNRPSVSMDGSAYLIVQMTMSVVCQMFYEISLSDSSFLSIAIPNNYLDFAQRAVRTADALVALPPRCDQPDSLKWICDYYRDKNCCVEEALDGSTFKRILVNKLDPNVNASAVFEWIKYIVPIDPANYGGVITETAGRILQLYGSGSVIGGCWNSLPNSNNPSKCYPSFSVSGKECGGCSDFVIHSQAASIIAGAAVVEFLQDH